MSFEDKAKTNHFVAKKCNDPKYHCVAISRLYYAAVLTIIDKLTPMLSAEQRKKFQHRRWYDKNSGERKPSTWAAVMAHAPDAKVQLILRNFDTTYSNVRVDADYKDVNVYKFTHGTSLKKMYNDVEDLLNILYK